MKAIEEYKEIKRLQKALKNNPNDPNILVQVAARVEDPEVKRKLLNKVLTLDSTNQTARDLLLTMDRGELQGEQPQPAKPEVFSNPAPIFAQPAPDPLEKPLTLVYAIVPQIVVYPLLAIALFLTLASMSDWNVFPYFASVFVFMLVPTWFVSATVRLDRSSITLKRMFGLYRREMEWSEIDRIQPIPADAGTKFISRDGRAMTISSKIYRHAFILETLWNLRPELFEGSGVSGPLRMGDTVEGVKVFGKNFVLKYAYLFFASSMSCLFLASLGTAQVFPAILMAIIIVLFWNTAFGAIHTVKLDGKTLIAQSFWKRHQYTAQQIKDIHIVTAYRYRKYWRTPETMVQVEFENAKPILLRGFEQNNENLCNFLKSWWQSCQTA